MDMEKRLRKTTMKQKEYVMNDKVLPYFGKMPINEITAPMIRKRMKDRIGRWRSFRSFQMRLWISKIHGLPFRFYFGQVCG